MVGVVSIELRFLLLFLLSFTGLDAEGEMLGYNALHVAVAQGE